MLINSIPYCCCQSSRHTFINPDITSKDELSARKLHISVSFAARVRAACNADFISDSASCLSVLENGFSACIVKQPFNDR